VIPCCSQRRREVPRASESCTTNGKKASALRFDELLKGVDVERAVGE
jgi:hypothetical protein